MTVIDASFRSRLTFASVGVVLLLSVVTVRLVQIELVHGDRLDEQARAHYEYKQTLKARRGRIFDRQGELLARSQSVFTLVVDSHHLRDLGLACIGLAKKEGVSPQKIRKTYLPREITGRYREYVAGSLAEILAIPKAELSRRLRERPKGEVVLKRYIEEDYARRIEAVLNENQLRGLYLRRGEKRFYPSPLALTQVIGYVNEEGDGLEGIEKTFNEEMRGTDGYRLCERDSRRREIHAFRGTQVDPVSGNDIYLTIDMALQAVVERELAAVVDRYEPEKVSAIWMDPRTGEILAMANRPHFDLATRKGILGQDPVRRNIAVTDQYQPGSTFKIVGYAGAFDRKVGSPTMQ
ncbi:MAG: penicillin-binding transpeptidase domain-containing protein, partial [Verrucomicrobiota bacterium]